jgi:hypothetical protein
MRAIAGVTQTSAPFFARVSTWPAGTLGWLPGRLPQMSATTAPAPAPAPAPGRTPAVRTGGRLLMVVVLITVVFVTALFVTALVVTAELVVAIVPATVIGAPTTTVVTVVTA